MRNGPSRLRLPLKLLAVAAGLLLLSLAAMQVLPLFRSQAVETVAGEDSTAATEPTNLEPSDSALVVEAEAAEAASTLSGSAAGHVLPRSPAARTDRKPSTIDVKLHRSEDDSVPMPPLAPIDEEISAAKLQQLHERIDELAQETAEWKQTVSASSPNSQREIDVILEQFEDQQAELRTVSQQVAVLEERLRTIQEDLKAVETVRASPRTEGQPPAKISIRTLTAKGKSQIVLDARDASLPELLARIGELSGVNLLVSADITGTISLHLKVADSDEALDAICRAHHCRQDRTGNIVMISRVPVAEKGAAKSEAPETVTKLYRLQHLSGPEIRPYVQALLTPDLGTVSFATIRERVARTEYRDPPRAILVKDTAQVISEVDRLILELDRPPTKGKSLRPLSQTRMERLLQASTPSPSPPARQPQPAPAPKLEPVPLPPPSEAWPSRRPATTPEPVPAPVLESPSGPALLPTGADLPGPCLDCEVFEPPLVQEEARKE